MKDTLYRLLIAPETPVTTYQQNKKIILNVLLLGTMAFLLISAIVATISYSRTGDTTTGLRILSTVLFLLLTVAIYFVARTGRSLLAAQLLVVLYVLFLSILLIWIGVYNPVGLVLAGFLIPLAGILLSARHAIGMLFLVFGLIIFVTIFHTPDMRTDSLILRTILLGAILGMMGLISWLFIRQVQQFQAKAQKYHDALKQERDNLEIKVQERTRELQEAQLEKLQQNHRFTELGYTSTAMLHDMANHLTTVSLDINGSKNIKPSVRRRLEQNLNYLNDAIAKSRSHIRGQKIVTTFNIDEELSQLFKALRHNRENDRVTIDYNVTSPHRQLEYRGDLIGLRQAISCLVMNAVDAYHDQPRLRAKKPRVTIQIGRENNHIFIVVSDKGKGISQEQHQHIFEPFYSTKEKGMGMGLFITKQIVENDLHGTIEFSSSKVIGTTFIIKLPI